MAGGQAGAPPPGARGDGPHCRLGGAERRREPVDGGRGGMQVRTRPEGSEGAAMVRGGEDPTEINALAILGADPDVRELASLERLRVMAAVAPRVRSLTEAQRAKKLRRESGAETTVGEVVDAQLARANIELDVLPLDGACPCGCKTKPTMGALRGAKRRGKTWTCRPEATRRFQASRTPEQRSESGQKARDKLTPERRAEISRMGGQSLLAATTPEQRTESARRASAAVSIEQRMRASRASAARAPEQRSESARKGSAARTPEQRSEASRKGHARKAKHAPQ